MPSTFRETVAAIVGGDAQTVRRMLEETPAFATEASTDGATRDDAKSFFFADIGHYLYAGDTCLHMAAAAFRSDLVQLLIDKGANVSAPNRRRAQPLHYAADTNHWNPEAQAAAISCLIAAGADPNATDKGGAAPLHRAVRTRSAAAVAALLDGGCDARQRNGRGSTPLHLAVQDTGRGGSGSDRAREQQQEIIGLLLQHGARPTDEDAAGKQVIEAATGDGIRRLLRSAD